VALGLIESGSMAYAFAKNGTLGSDYTPLTIITMITALTCGAVLVMWLGERITENGIGNGISIILLINIISRMPNDFYTLYEQFMKGKQIGPALIAGVIIVGVVLFTTVFIIILSDAERHIPIQYSKKIQGRKMAGNQATNIPLKVNTAGVIPIIFASSILQFPLIIQQLLNYQNNGIVGKILVSLSSSSWFDVDHPVRSLGLVVYIFLIIVFAYFYTSITFNPIEVANNMKKQGGMIPGIRPGKPTQEYLSRLLNFIIFIGAAGLVIVAVIPFFFNGVFSANVSFGGTSLIIVVGVILETKKQIESQVLVRKYTGFLNN
jgi:preprotein translocase subunit SecY